MPVDRFICAINRDRDGYQVPLALYEAGLLERFVTDYYTPDVAPRWLPTQLARRRVEGLPAAMTRNAPVSFFGQSVAHLLRLPMNRVFAATDRLLARTVGEAAARADAHLYCYHSYLPSERSIAPGTRRVVFQYHPPPAFSLDVLRADHARWPQVAWSVAQAAGALAASPADDEWRRADAVVCASAMTRRSLEHDGCPPERIAVIPYGLDAAASPPAARQPGPAEFLFVGQGVQRKGLHHLIAAWQAADLADARLTLVCATFDPGIRAMIRSPSIRVLERQSREQLDALYAAADIFVMPSLLEGFGLVYGEALARGCHVIGTANTGLPDLHLPANAATLVELGNVDGLSTALTRTRDMAVAGGFDRPAIAATAAAQSWQAFRHAIADHARSVLAR